MELVESNPTEVQSLMFSTLRPERMRAITVFRDRSFRGTGREDSDQSEKPWENPARRWIQSMDLRQA